MAHLNWMPELDTGIPEIDRQHRRIVQYINDLHDARLTRDLSLVGQVIDEAVDYTLSHFAFEEALMNDAGYMYSGPHKKVHELFARKVAEYQVRHQAGEDVSEEFHGMLSRWLFNHIRNDDQSYVDAVNLYMRVQRGGVTGLKAQIRAEVLSELAHEKRQGGFWSRLFGR